MDTFTAEPTMRQQRRTQKAELERLSQQHKAAQAVVAFIAQEHYKLDGDPELTDAFRDMWNAAHDAVSAIEGEMHVVGLPIIRPQDFESARLAYLNID